MIALYRPGTGLLHRLPAGVKLAGLAACALALSVWRPEPVGMLAAVLGVSAMYPIAGLPIAALGRAWWRLRWIVLVLGGALWLFAGTDTALVNTGRVVALVLLADLVTRTTRSGDLLAVLERVLRPLHRFRVDAEAVALTISLTIAMVPVIAGLADQVRDAQRARGARLGVRAALPLLILTMKHADDVGDALVARGIVR
ncbi:energy-coupling factor transporter transmembrane protein EcfT [Microbacterium bovistercoris]|uniref:Energy-coupling factor transporter transmembrane protein EcfT n=1 Tax=Microbacterium bovistercoris TaxID=2293570 RepID=A0A371NQL8_9MICO|nr:energy-coupling factor transporter transmembrane component T [Microbacterium bovistercoris]REJ04441.1 energy-coupling factor transporter transmembrane protein EcfT [Microbacterium bovistercoris]